MSRGGSRGYLAVTLGVLLLSTCTDDDGSARAQRPACVPHQQRAFGPDEPDEGPCTLDGGLVDGQPWALVGSWNRRPSEGSSGNGPCIDLQVSIGSGASGAGWCDLPEARLIGEWTSKVPTGSAVFAWGPTSAGGVAEVRIEFDDGDPIVIPPKPTPWEEFDYWFAAFPVRRHPTALVAMDGGGKELAREDISGMPR